MEDNWPPPNTPELRKDFDRAGRPIENAKTEKGGDLRSVSTKAELQRLEKEREVPERKNELTPSGSGSALDQKRRIWREQRIKELEERLKNQRNKARDDFNRSM